MMVTDGREAGMAQADFKMHDGWQSHAGNDGDMTWVWLSRSRGCKGQDDVSFYDVMIIVPAPEADEPSVTEQQDCRRDGDGFYRDNPRILIHPPGGDPVLVLSMRGDKLVIVGYDKNHVSFSEGVDYE